MDKQAINKYIHLMNIKRSMLWYILFIVAFSSCFIFTKFIQTQYIAEMIKTFSGYTIITLFNTAYCSGLMTCYLVTNYIVYPLCDRYARL